MVGWLYVVVGGGQRPKMLDISRHPTKVLPTILKVTEDDELSFETLGNFCDVVGQIHLVVRR